MLLKEKAYYWNNGTFYYGQWLNNKINGVGILINSQNVIFGQFNSGLLHGYCQFIYCNKHQFCKYDNGQQIGVIKYEYFNGEVTIDKTNRCSQEEYDIIEKLDHQYFLILLKTQLKSWKIISETQMFFSTLINQQENKRIEIGLMYDLSGRFEYGYFNNQLQEGKGGIIFESGDRYVGELKNGKLHGIGIFYNKIDNLYTQSRFEENQIVEILKQQQEQIILRSQWHQIPEPEYLKQSYISTPKKQNQNYYSTKNASNKLSQSVSPMRPTVSIKREAMYSQIKNYPNIENKFGSIQTHFGREDLQIILPYKSRQLNSYKKFNVIDDKSKADLRAQLHDEEKVLINL